MTDKLSNYIPYIEKRLDCLMKPQPYLDIRLFNSKKILRSKIRSALLYKAQLLVDFINNNFIAIEIKDVVLCGSSNSYFYNEFSDIDIKIILKKTKKNDLGLSLKQIYLLVSKYSKKFFKLHKRISIFNRNLDIGFAIEVNDRQLYSILHNKWIKKPSKFVMKNINRNKVLEDTYLLINEIDNMQTDKFDRSYGKFKLKDLIKMIMFYNDVVKSKSTTPHNLLICKLLVYSNKLRALHLFYRKELTKLLSF